MLPLHVDTVALLSFIDAFSTNATFDEFLTRHRIYDRPATFEQLIAKLDEEERNDDEFREDTKGAVPMDPKKLVEFLGHSSIYEPLDDYLLQHGIKKRPQGPDLTDWVSDKISGISLEFSASFDSESLYPRKSPGNFVLRAIKFEKAEISGLPFGLDFAMSQDGVTAILGEPRATTNIPSAKYFYQGVVISVRRNEHGRGIYLLTVAVPDICSKKNLNLDV